ncbi:hypothetical protein NIES4102_42200 (plasmid) [Chondrocystis sp. NIES-4102]|nr:hypothetical protein NIES4102_41070 [Chondrocystis sp. NIES-4102]BAZ47174.1 hypothetical protein NIES4102_42200 [Chondrocystis sp. NIES-4102]
MLSSYLVQRFNSLGIPFDHAIASLINQYHTSQVSAALDHVERNREFIRSPKAVFLYQLPKQPVIENKPLLPIYSASDFSGFTIAHLKTWYPNHWRQATLHFGLTVPHS